VGSLEAAARSAGDASAHERPKGPAGDASSGDSGDGVADRVRRVVAPPVRPSDGGVAACDVAAANAAAEWLAAACAAGGARSALVQALNEARVGEVSVPPETFEALGNAVAAALSHCDAQRDVKNARQLMIMSETYKRRSSGSFGGGPGAEAAPSREWHVSRCGEVAAHALWGRQWFWEELLLFGVASQFERSPQAEPWEALPPDKLHDEVPH
jgi:hypothetical protein